MISPAPAVGSSRSRARPPCDRRSRSRIAPAALCWCPVDVLPPDVSAFSRPALHLFTPAAGPVRAFRG